MLQCFANYHVPEVPFNIASILVEQSIDPGYIWCKSRQRSLMNAIQGRWLYYVGHANGSFVWPLNEGLRTVRIVRLD